jgi:hypothetical protein
MAHVTKANGTRAGGGAGDEGDGGDDSDDPLEAFMAGVTKQAAQDRANMGQKEVAKRDDYEEEDDHEKYYKKLQACAAREEASMQLLPALERTMGFGSELESGGALVGAGRWFTALATGINGATVHWQEARAKQALADEEEQIQYDSDDNPIVPDTKEILPLPDIDHSQVM